MTELEARAREIAQDVLDRGAFRKMDLGLGFVRGERKDVIAAALVALAREAVEAEREACAQFVPASLPDVRAAIRARGKGGSRG